MSPRTSLRPRLWLLAAIATVLGVAASMFIAPSAHAAPGSAYADLRAGQAFITTDSAVAARHIKSPSATRPAPEVGLYGDHCTGFCVALYNGTNRNLLVGGNPGSALLSPGRWSDEEHTWLTDVDWMFVPAGCTITFRGRTYQSGEMIDIDGISPYVWIYGSC
jgi:hypothetical protein